MCLFTLPGICELDIQKLGNQEKWCTMPIEFLQFRSTGK
jgi:hypothetical protein